MGDINEVFRDHIQHQKEAGKIRLAKMFSKMSSINALGSLYKQLPMVIKDKNFGRAMQVNTLGRRQEKYT